MYRLILLFWQIITFLFYLAKIKKPVSQTNIAVFQKC